MYMIQKGLLPTPKTSQDFKPIRSLSPSEANGTHGKSLVSAIGDMMEKNLLPTPSAHEHKYRLKQEQDVLGNVSNSIPGLSKK